MTYCTFLEGEQAEAYKKRKAAEKEKEGKQNPRYQFDWTRDTNNFNHVGKYAGVHGDKKSNIDKNEKLRNKTFDSLIRDKKYNDLPDDDKRYEKRRTMYDATSRHYRRHPQAESAGIFADIELV